MRPNALPTSGALPGSAFVDAVCQVVCAINRDDSLPVSTGIRLRHRADEDITGEDIAGARGSLVPS